MRMVITGDNEIELTLKQLADKAADRVARAAVNAGLQVIVKAIRKEAPKGETGTLKKSIGKRFEKATRFRPAVAKAGVNVGRRKKKGQNKRVAPHSHLVALGTRRRERASGGSTGAMPSNAFVRRAVKSSQSQVMEKMRAKAQERLAKEVVKSKSANTGTSRVASPMANKGIEIIGF